MVAPAELFNFIKNRYKVCPGFFMVNVDLYMYSTGTAVDRNYYGDIIYADSNTQSNYYISSERWYAWVKWNGDDERVLRQESLSVDARNRLIYSGNKVARDRPTPFDGRRRRERKKTAIGKEMK